jgi:hypothetical protein
MIGDRVSGKSSEIQMVLLVHSAGRFESVSGKRVSGEREMMLGWNRSISNPPPL